MTRCSKSVTVDEEELEQEHEEEREDGRTEAVRAARDAAREHRPGENQAVDARENHRPPLRLRDKFLGKAQDAAFGRIAQFGPPRPEDAAGDGQHDGAENQEEFEKHDDIHRLLTLL